MQTIFLWLLVIFPVTVIAQPEIQINAETINGNIVLYTENTENYPVSISLELTLENLKSDKEQEKVFVIPEHSTHYRLIQLNKIEKTRNSTYSLKFTSVPGNVNLSAWDSSYQYDLPYKKGQGYLLFQGYNGHFTHQNENALDFEMPEGTEILAAREGVVVKVVQNNTESCPEKECEKFNNYILIYHSDGTFALYNHIRYNGAAVKQGDKINKGDMIAYSGKTGWATGPHLHFECYLPAWKHRKTIMTAFRIEDGSAFEYLKEGKTYRRRY